MSSKKHSQRECVQPRRHRHTTRQ